MSHWTDARITAALGLGAHAGGEDVVYGGVSTDTRALRPGALFVALRGATHDAHDYLAQAAAAGARGAIVERLPADAPAGLRYYLVPITLHALGQLARCHRRTLGAHVCVVAGSNGKTTTKDLLRAVFSARYRVHATNGNFNNLVGAPLTMLAAPADAEIVIAEIGTNAPGEVAQLAAIIEPDAAVITGISAEHLEGLGDLGGVLREETSVLPWLPPQGLAVVADEPPALAARAQLLYGNVVAAGFTERAAEAARGADAAVDDDGRARFRWRGQDVALQLRGRHNARNALLALALGERWGVAPEAGAAAVAGLPGARLRSEVHRFGGLTVIADCYNANPASTDAAVDLLVSMPRQGGRVVVLGSMLELGSESAAIHAECARAIAARGLDLIVATGAFVPAFAPLGARLAGRLLLESDPLRAYELLEPALAGDEVVLLKGSRGVALERLLPRFEAKWGALHPHGEAFGSRASSLVTGARDEARPAERPHGSTSTASAATPPAEREA
ncbi:MAG: UDP-N-acetylmuramoyl-tripeptide--D-alanyl-D-alanine ligase [Gemmatimonadetes bacterium]|nr:UDP-N-acetylmuramoyl-tripeptide--D-alanyl-D-alanine ligase [Gemmatimonadota bacterium]